MIRTPGVFSPSEYWQTPGVSEGVFSIKSACNIEL
jgi:hypothetical protein